MANFKLPFFSAVLVLFSYVSATAQASPDPSAGRWSAKAANDWYAKQPWLVGSNYIPANAINELEMWQQDTFDPKKIDLELGWAQSLGMNIMRVFLHDLLWQQDAQGFIKRVDTFLGIADKHHIKILFVLFDSCWDPNPQLGRQRDPRPGIHNSGWVQSPGAAALEDPLQYPRLEAYARGIVSAFRSDKRILGWDVWNEPSGTNPASYEKEDPKDKVSRVLTLLPQAFGWVRSAHPSQPLTSGLWEGDWSSVGKLGAMEKLQLELSDVISFHNYAKPDDFEKRVFWLRPYHRPILCTEYMARGAGSTFQEILLIAKKFKVAAINWGLVAGKTQTYYPWDSWQNPYVDQPPPVWHHDVFHPDGKPYSEAEVAFIRQITGRYSAPTHD
jgi:Cellulase (glycosyl hydrolase family 5)